MGFILLLIIKALWCMAPVFTVYYAYTVNCRPTHELPTIRLLYRHTGLVSLVLLWYWNLLHDNIISCSDVRFDSFALYQHFISIIERLCEPDTLKWEQEAEVVWQMLHQMTPAQWSRVNWAAWQTDWRTDWRTDGQTDRQTEWHRAHR